MDGIFFSRNQEIEQKFCIFKTRESIHTSYIIQCLPLTYRTDGIILFSNNLYDVSKIQKKTEDAGKENAIKTRPRLVMTPAVSMDDIENPRAREILCNEMYTSTITRATREAAASCDKIKAPFLGHPSPSNPVAMDFKLVFCRYLLQNITKIYDRCSWRGPTSSFV